MRLVYWIENIDSLDTWAHEAEHGLMTERRLRVLCFHGYHGSASILRSQMAGLVSAMPSDIDFLYVDAPSLARGDFGWWHEGFSGWKRTLAWARELFDTQPRLDGVFGFSQGAALVGLLAAANESETYRTSEEGWFDFAALVGGFKSDLPQHADLFQRKLAIPSVHVMGQSDGIVPSRDSRVLAAAFKDPLIIEHSGGHVVPAIEAVTHPVAHFFIDHAVPEASTGTA
jgi:dienelactone hydrolase